MGGLVRQRGPYQSAASQIEEMVALNELAATRELTAAESERLGELILREQKRAKYRPNRMARLRAELALLESLEIAERGGAAVPPRCEHEIDAVRAGNGSWSVPLRRVA